MVQRRFLYYWFFSSLAFLVIGMVVFVFQRPGITKGRYDRITFGMTREEVEALVGPPNKIYGHIEVAPNIVRGAVEKWESGNGSAHFEFDKNDRLQFMSWHSIPDDRTVIQKLVDLITGKHQ